MGGFQDILILVSFLIEVAVLLYLELKAWRSLYTPLVFLALPYVIVLLISIAISGNYGFVEFYYPSILLWSVGLLIFAIPSLTFGFLLQRAGLPQNSCINEEAMPQWLALLAFAVVALFLYRFKSLYGGAHVIGSHDFGDALCGDGFWGHLRQLSLPILMIAIYSLDKTRRWLWLIIIPLFGVALLYQVLGWIIIPCMGGVVMRLYSGKTKLKPSLFLYVILGGSAVFLVSYVISIVVVAENDLDNDVFTFIFKNFIHYLTSGTLGLSVDMERNFPDAGSFEVIWAPIVNVINVILGKDEIVSPVNPFYYNTGLNLTNVRTFFGTLYIYTNAVEFVGYILLSSSLMYLLKLMTIKWKNIYVYAAYFFECGLLAMGWFEFYYFHLVVFELPAIVFALWLVDKVLRSRGKALVPLKNE